MPRTALIFGSTGLTGGHCLTALLNSDRYKKVISLVRRSAGLQHPKLKEHIIDFNKLTDYHQLIQADDLYCCMGTTIKKAGSKEQFKKVDFHYPFEIAKIAVTNGAKQFMLVSSIGADAKSLFFYTKVKGELEQAINHLGYETVHILQPSFLLGNRQEFRAGEKFGIAAAKAMQVLMVGPLKKYRGIEAKTVAEVMLALANRQEKGRFVWESDEIQELGR